MPAYMEVWINTNEATDSDEKYYDVEVALIDGGTVKFDCESKEAAEKLKQCVLNYAVEVGLN